MDKRERKIMCKIEDELLDFGRIFDDLTTSDAQGVAMAKAKKICELCSTIPNTD